ncbi:MAG: FadR family transcriptional regulator [Rhodospirillaceae bacterium]|nr:FadR family transcriptional regulator [Rhodospirillaceae bacterium]
MTNKANPATAARPLALPRVATAAPAGRRAVHGTVVRELARRILGGVFTPGTALPNEAELCAELKVSRSTLREAIRVLAAKGLVESRPRTGTRVREREDWDRLDPDLLQWAGELEPDIDFVAGLIEARRIIEPAAAEFAARRASARDLAAIEEAFEGMAAALPHDIEAYCRSDLAFHSAILKASRNPVLAHLSGIIGAALMSAFRLTTEHARSYQRTLQVHADVLDAIRLRDTAQARETMLRLITVAADDLGDVAQIRPVRARSAP